jgi:hypothetical protein
MNKTDELLLLCQQQKMYVQVGPNRIFVTLGRFYGIGASLAEAIENWCQQVEKELGTKYDLASVEANR